MNTETVTVYKQGEDYEITVQHNQSCSSYGITLSKNAYEQLRQHFVRCSLPRNKRTEKNNETELFVDTYIKEHGYPPTYIEIVERFNLRSTSAAYARCRHFRYKMHHK